LRRAAFFDRDGVLNVDHGYVFAPADWEWNSGAREAIRLCNDRGYAVVVVTNQSGIGRNFYSTSDVETLHAFVQQDLAAFGAHIDGFYFCPHLPEDGCECRKPLPGMIVQAIQELELDPSNSFLVGDKDSDMRAAHSAGIEAVLYQGGDLLELVRTQLR
jgi:D-glycero-D-manno-heptose 1,7-bisphosphate phosphatase